MLSVSIPPFHRFGKGKERGRRLVTETPLFANNYKFVTIFIILKKYKHDISSFPKVKTKAQEIKVHFLRAQSLVSERTKVHVFWF